MHIREGLRFIPSLMTLGNLVLGFSALMLVYHGYLGTAAMLVVLGAVIDAFDGRVARALGCVSLFGKELDSLSDIVAFGAAPAFIMYAGVLQSDGLLGTVIAILFPLCGAVRLARFNVQSTSSRYFVGLPITAAGSILATLVLYQNDVGPSSIVMPLCMVILSFLMVSRAKYPNFKRIGFPRSATVMVPASIVFIYIAFRFDRAIANRLAFVPLAVYALYGIVRVFRKRPLHTPTADPEEGTKSV